MNGSNRIRLIRAQAKSDAEKNQSVAAKAVGYIRVSTEEQAVNGHGLEVQERAIRAFAESQGYELLDVIADPGISGARAPAERPGFRRVLQLAQERAFSLLLVWKFDRLARSLLFSVTTVNELQERHAIVLRSVTEPIDTATPMGGMIFAILASFAAEERRVITSRTLAGRKEKASRGGFAGGAAPLGYVKDLRGGLIVDDLQAAVVLRVIELHREGLSLHTIANMLNNEGRFSKRGGRFYPSTVRYILDNPKYRGFVEYYFRHDGEAHCLTQGSHKAILPKAA
jgi:site-specific DNA recombinase